jgi:hypothetical protein
MARYDFPQVKVKENTPSKLVVANNDRVGLAVLRVLFSVIGPAFFLLGAYMRSLPIAAVGLPLLGYGLFGLLFLPTYGCIVADRRSGLLEASLECAIPFSGPQGKSRRQKVITTPYQCLTVCSVVPGYSAGFGRRLNANNAYQGYRIELLFDSGDTVSIPCDSHDVAMNQAGLIHQWLADAGVEVELAELSEPRGPMAAYEVLNLAIIMFMAIAILLALSVPIVKYFLANR